MHSVCVRYGRTPSRPTVGLQLAEDFNQVISIDLGELDGDRFLVMVDWATRYCQAIWVNSKNLGEMIDGVMVKWINYFGASRSILADGEREFQNEEFIEFTQKW